MAQGGGAGPRVAGAITQCTIRSRQSGGARNGLGEADRLKASGLKKSWCIVYGWKQRPWHRQLRLLAGQCSPLP
jgi:hypothetical protein